MNDVTPQPKKPEAHLNLNVQPNLFAGYGGEVRRPGFRPRHIAALVAVLLVGATIGIVTNLLVRRTLPLPQNSRVLAYLTPSRALPEASPELWLETRAAHPRTPIFVGFSEETPGELIPFTVTPKLFSWKLEGVEYTSESLQRPVDLAASWHSFISGPWLRINTQTAEEDTGFVGRISKGTWNTNLPAPSLVMPRTYDVSDMNMIHVAAFPAAWESIQEQFRANNVPLSLPEVPNVAHWRTTEKGVDFVFEFLEPPSDESRTLLAAAAGLTEDVPYTLPDGTVATEIRAPKIPAGDQAIELGEGRVLRFWDRYASLGTESLELHDVEDSSCGDGPSFAAFDHQAVQNLFSLLDLPDLFPRSGVTLSSKGDKVQICWEET